MATPRSQSTAVLAGAVLAALLGVSACNGDSDPDAGAETSDDTTAPGIEDDQAAPAPDVDDVPDVVAEVDGHEITKDDFVSTYEAQFQQASMQSEMGGEPVDEELLRQQVLDALIDNQLLAQEAEDQELDASDEEIDSTLEELASGNGMETDDFLAALQEQGLSEDEVRTELGNQVRIDKLFDQEVPVEDPSEEELQQRYDDIVEQEAAAAPTGDDDAATGGPESELPPFEEVRDQIEEQMRSESQELAAQGYLEELRDSAEITSHL